MFSRLRTCHVSCKSVSVLKDQNLSKIKNKSLSLTFTLCLNYYSKTNGVSFTFNTAFLPQLAEQSTTIFVSTMNEVRVDL